MEVESLNINNNDVNMQETASRNIQKPTGRKFNSSFSLRIDMPYLAQFKLNQTNHFTHY